MGNLFRIRGGSALQASKLTSSYSERFDFLVGAFSPGGVWYDEMQRAYNLLYGTSPRFADFELDPYLLAAGGFTEVMPNVVQTKDPIQVELLGSAYSRAAGYNGGLGFAGMGFLQVTHASNFILGFEYFMTTANLAGLADVADVSFRLNMQLYIAYMNLLILMFDLAHADLKAAGCVVPKEVSGVPAYTHSNAKSVIAWNTAWSKKHNNKRKFTLPLVDGIRHDRMRQNVNHNLCVKKGTHPTIGDMTLREVLRPTYTLDEENNAVMVAGTLVKEALQAVLILDGRGGASVERVVETDDLIKEMTINELHDWAVVSNPPVYHLNCLLYAAARINNKGDFPSKEDAALIDASTTAQCLALKHAGLYQNNIGALFFKRRDPILVQIPKRPCPYKLWWAPAFVKGSRANGASQGKDGFIIPDISTKSGPYVYQQGTIGRGASLTYYKSLYPQYKDTFGTTAD